jgi:hypothetical protein
MRPSIVIASAAPPASLCCLSARGRRPGVVRDRAAVAQRCGLRLCRIGPRQSGTAISLAGFVVLR